MPRTVPAHPRSVERPSLSLCHAFGLAAVAAELSLQVEALEPETAKAVERGAAALFLAGYGPGLRGNAASSRLMQREGERATRRGLVKSGRPGLPFGKKRARAIAAN